MVSSLVDTRSAISGKGLNGDLSVFSMFGRHDYHKGDLSRSTGFLRSLGRILISLLLKDRPKG